jgi:hypothetical protein
MNIVLFIHGKASAGKDYFVKSLKYYMYLHKAEYFSEPEKRQDIKNLFTDKPSCFDVFEIVKMPFADEVRKELCQIDPKVNYERLCSDYEYKTQYRKQLVEIGDGYRKERPDIWIEKHFEALKDFNTVFQDKIICVPDMRYHTNDLGSEWDYSKEVCKLLDILSFRVKINCPVLTRLERMSPEAIKAYTAHGMFNASETGMDHVPDNEFDFVLDNSQNFKTRKFPSDFTKLSWQIIELHDKIKAV